MSKAKPANTRQRFVELDSLRGIGILAVLWTHAGLGGVGGAFLFVDMFFVISGYLIASTFMASYQRQAGDQSTWRFCGQFFARRIRRIIPTLLIALLFILIVAWFVLLPLEYAELAKSVLFTTFINGNLYAASLGDYFSISPSQAPLLHTWSLSLEEQFYLITPLILLPMFWLNRSVWIGVLMVACLASIWTASMYSMGNSHEAYFLFRTRIWQYLFGILVAILLVGGRFNLSANLRNMLGYASLGVFLVCCFVFTKWTPAPSYITAIPLAAFALFILLKPDNWVLDLVLKSKWLAFLGGCTYSIYLLHFPLMSFVDYRGIGLGEFHEVWLVILSLVLGIGFSITVEKYQNNWKNVSFFKTTVLCGILLAVIIGACSKIINSGGEPARLSGSAQTYYRAATDVNPYRAQCMLGDRILAHGYSCKFDFGHEKSVLLFGDSHSDAVAPAFIQAMDAQGFNVIHLWYAGCPPVLNAVTDLTFLSEDCRNFNLDASRFIVQTNTISAAFLMARWSWYYTAKPFADDTEHLRFKSPYWKKPNAVAPDGFADMTKYQQVFSAAVRTTLTDLRAQGIDIYLFEPVPEMRINVPLALAKSAWYGTNRPTATIQYADYIQYNKKILTFFATLEAEKRLSLIPSSGAFCMTQKNGSCLSSDREKIYYYDSHHLNNAGASRLINWAFWGQ